MSPHDPPARIHLAPVSTGRMALSVGVMTASSTTTMTTGTGTTGSGRAFVRR